ncbi:MAG: STAS domain-containing protein [Deltaproteobacteria bacterium]|nr:MAG: STAS domain-containing protein [Deltaproteobacteria bacterium]
MKKDNVFEITTRLEEGGIMILKIAGYVDASNINHFEQQLGEQINKGYYKIILDCSELEYLNSSALGIILDFHKLAAKHQGGIRLLNLSHRIESTFNMLGFNDYFLIFSEEKKAIESFNK